jgi:hypothetical protein
MLFLLFLLLLNDRNRVPHLHTLPEPAATHLSNDGKTRCQRPATPSYLIHTGTRPDKITLSLGQDANRGTQPLSVTALHHAMLMLTCSAKLATRATQAAAQLAQPDTCSPAAEAETCRSHHSEKHRSHQRDGA